VSLIRRKKKVVGPTSPFIPLREAAALLCLDESTVRKGRAGTANLTIVRQGGGKRRRVFLVRLEVEQHIRQMIEEARRKKERPFKIVYGI
jgi:hypothetical protein